MPGLCSNFVEFFNDNVNMMVMAATIGSFASGVSGRMLGPGAGAIMLGQLQMVLCFVIVAILRVVGLLLYKRATKDSVMREVYGSMLLGLPWFLRVPTVVVIPDYLQALYNEIGWDPANENKYGRAAPAFCLTIIVFSILFMLLLLLGKLSQSRRDAAAPDSRWTTFFVQCFYLAAMSGTGKALHYSVRIIIFALAGPTDMGTQKIHWHHLQAWTMSLAVLTAITWCMLSSTLPNQMDNPSIQDPNSKLNLTCQQYVTVYTWAFGVVNFGWTVLYNYIGGVMFGSYYIGMFLFMCWLAVTLGFACVLAATTPDKNFYDMGKGNSKKGAACLMNYWLVDFITWWAQAQFVTSLDTDVSKLGNEGARLDPTSWTIIGINFLVLLSALFVVGAVHACNEEALMHQAAKGEKHKTKVFSGDDDGPYIKVGSREDEEDDEDDDSESSGSED